MTKTDVKNVNVMKSLFSRTGLPFFYFLDLCHLPATYYSWVFLFKTEGCSLRSEILTGLCYD